jgi:uncharacterized membrane protein
METNLLSSSDAGQATNLPPATGSSKINVGTVERIASVITGTALAIYAVRNWNNTSGKLLGLTSLILLKRGSTGYCEINNAIGRNSALKKASAMEADATFTINKPKEEVFAFWRELSNLPVFMQHLKKVEVQDQQRSRWTAKLPGGVATISWEAIIQEEEPNHLIAWSSLPGSTIDNAGEVRFSDAPGNEGTVVQARISYRLPAGDLGSVAGKLFNPLVENMIRQDLRRFKSFLETGQAVSGIPSGNATSNRENYLVE